MIINTEEDLARAKEYLKNSNIEEVLKQVEAKDAQIRALRKGYIDMALIIEQLTTKDLTEEAIKDMRERADRLKEGIK